MTPDKPLTDAELDELSQFLIGDDMPEETMDIAMLDGFLTGIVISPNTLSPSRWLAAIWDEGEANPMAWKSADQMQHIIGLIMRMYNDRVHDLQEDIAEFEPLIYQSEQEGETVPILDEWCTGFISAIGLDPDGWAPLIDADSEHEGGGLLTPMLLYGTEDGWEQIKQNEGLAARHQDFADALGPCVIGIRDYWLPYRKEASTYRRETDKVGRNDACPCGSGKKFKKCCGGGETLH
jgi:uncharacterized protein